jgi:hypothetical protein
MALTKINNNTLSAVTTLPAAIPVGSITKLQTQTASSSSTITYFIRWWKYFSNCFSR